MMRRSLGNTGWLVSPVALGTVELGMDYGFAGSAHYRRPDRAEAVRLVRTAVDLGVNLIDTARAYGEAEDIVGEALAGVSNTVFVATKFHATEGAAIRESVERSLRLLRRDVIDVLQIHNGTAELLARDEIFECLDRLAREGKIRFAGCSVYGESNGLLALDHAELRTLQVPLNLLDQKMARRVIPRAQQCGTGVMVRSVFLRGVLTARAGETPARLAPLRDAAMRIGEPVERLAEIALRYALSVEGVSSVLVGVRTVEELEENIRAASAGPLPREFMDHAEAFAVDDEELTNPGNWTGLI